MLSGFALSNLLAQLQVGRRPTWTALSVATADGAPASASAGVPLENAVQTYVWVKLRSDAHRRRALVTIGALDATATYTVTVAGTGMAKATPADVDAALVGLRDAIAADGTVGGAAGASQLVTSQCLDADGEVTEGTAAGGEAAVSLEVLGTVEADWTVAVSATGSGAVNCTADASACGLRLWSTPRDPGVQGLATGWAQVPGSAFTLDRRGMHERFDTAAISRLYPEIHTVTGVAGDGAGVTATIAEIAVGPAISED